MEAKGLQWTEDFEHKLRVKLEDLEKNSIFQIVRSILIYADRMVSMNQSNTDKFLNNNKEFMQSIIDTSMNMSTQHDITMIESNYDTERLKKQTELLNEINHHNNNIVGANAGYGKTLVGLKWILQKKKKCMWVVPRNVIARGTYDSIINELKNFNNGEQLSVALLLGGVYEYGNENSDIIVTNIDNFLAPMVKNSEAHHQINIITNNAIFDEYHEFLSDAPLFSAFIGTVYTRTHFTNSNTLLLSATPLRFDMAYWNQTKDIKGNNLYEFVHFINPEPFNGNMNVRIIYKEVRNVGDIQPEEKDAFIIGNTVRQTQRCFEDLKDNNKKLIHALFTPEDRTEIENYLYSTHGKHGLIANRNLFIGTNIIGVGLDVSAKAIYDFVISPENTIQRACGRGGRFAEPEYNNEITYYICNIIGDKGSTKLINKAFTKSLQEKWIDVLEEYNGLTITKNKLYQLYHQFYTDNKAEIEQLWRNFFKESAAKLRQMKTYHNKKKNKKEENKTLSSGIGFIGDNNSIYVTAKHTNDNNYCNPVIVDSNKISDKVHPEEYYTSSLTARRNYLLNTDYSLKYVLKNAKKPLCSMVEIYMQLAKSKDTPFLLCCAKYDKQLGLILGDKTDIDYDDD